jgi:threo-3-hydroxy-L-aspartate ammonia-lyase
MEVDIDDVRQAAARIATLVHRTPVLTSRTLDARVGGALHLKAEALQRTGSFKVRGAANRIAALSAGQRHGGVVAYSSGNHAQAVALAARELGSSAVIVLPADAPAVKRAATAGYGAQIVTYDRRSESRDDIAARLAADRGLTLVPPFDDPLVIAGQGTVALELLAQVAELDVLVVPVGGGGLISGCAVVVKALAPRVRVVGVEPAGADAARRSLDAGRRVRVAADSIADGLLAPSPGELPFALMSRLVDDVVTVDDRDIAAAMRLLFERLKLVTEPSGAIGVAAALCGALDLRGAAAGIVVSGGNVDASRFCALTAAREAVS